MSLVKNILSSILLILLAIVLVLLPSVVYEPFMNATQTGDYLPIVALIFFLVIAVTSASAIGLYKMKKKIKIELTAIEEIQVEMLKILKK